MPKNIYYEFVIEPIKPKYNGLILIGKVMDTNNVLIGEVTISSYIISKNNNNLASLHCREKKLRLLYDLVISVDYLEVDKEFQKKKIGTTLLLRGLKKLLKHKINNNYKEIFIRLQSGFLGSTQEYSYNLLQNFYLKVFNKIDKFSILFYSKKKKIALMGNEPH